MAGIAPQSKPQRILERHKELKQKRQRWHRLWQLVGEYIHTTKQSFTSTQMPGDFLNQEVFDSTGRKSNVKMAASLMGMLWQNGGSAFQLIPVDNLPKSKKIKQYFDKINRNVTKAFDDPKAGLSLSLEEYFIDQGAFGTSGIGVFPGKQGSSLQFRAYGVQSAAIDESSAGFINTIYCEMEWTTRQVIEEYGIESVSKNVRESAASGKMEDKVKILQVVQPRELINVEVLNNLNMPYESLHMELESKHILRESGFQELPIFFARFHKNFNEIYGRAPGIDALPDVLELNAVKEARMLAQEKSLDPPLGIMHDSMLGGNKVDTSSGAINVFKASDQIGNQNPIFPLFTVGDIGQADKQIEQLKLDVTEHFNLDRLLDFNNQAEMTLGEALLRQRIRGESLGSLFTRQIKELNVPLIERGVNILFRRGLLGVLPGPDALNKVEARLRDDVILIPDEVAELLQAGEEFYNIKFLTPAARLIEAEKAQGIVQAWQFAASLGPQAADNLDIDKSVQIVAENAGAPLEVLVDEETKAQVRQVRQQQLEQQAALQQAQAAAAAAKDGAQAEAAATQTA